MELKVLIDSEVALSKLLKVSLPARKSYELRNFISSIKDKILAYHETRKDLFEKYGEKLEDGTIQIKPKNNKEFFEELNEVLKDEVEVVIPEITIDDIKSDIDTETLITLDWLVK